MKVSFPHTDLLIEHLAQATKVSSILFDHRSRNRNMIVYIECIGVCVCIRECGCICIICEFIIRCRISGPTSHWQGRHLLNEYVFSALKC